VSMPMRSPRAAAASWPSVERSGPSEVQSQKAGAPPSALVVERRGEPLAVRLTVPSVGFVIYQASTGFLRQGNHTVHRRESAKTCTLPHWCQ